MMIEIIPSYYWCLCSSGALVTYIFIELPDSWLDWSFSLKNIKVACMITDKFRLYHSTIYLDRTICQMVPKSGPMGVKNRLLTWPKRSCNLFAIWSYWYALKKMFKFILIISNQFIYVNFQNQTQLADRLTGHRLCGAVDDVYQDVSVVDYWDQEKRVACCWASWVLAQCWVVG